MTIITKSIIDKKDEKDFLNDIEGPLNVAVSVPQDAPTPIPVPVDEVDASSTSVRLHNKMGGFRFLFVVILVVTALTSGFCFFRAVNVAHYRRGLCTLPFDLRFFDDTTLISGKFSNYKQNEGLLSNPEKMPESHITEVKETLNEKLVETPDGRLGLEYEIDLEMETFEMTQMPQLSRGKYLHDFKMNKTLIIDTDNNRCFIMTLNRDEVKPPKDFMDFITRLNNGVYQLDLDEVRHDTRVVTPELDRVDWREYGVHIANNCRGRTSYLLEEVEKLLMKRSAVPENKFQFIEFTGKIVKYNIVNLHEL